MSIILRIVTALYLFGMAGAAGAIDVVGTWRLISIETVRPGGEIIYDWMGEKPTGLIMYQSNGLMSVQIMKDPRPVFAEGSRLKATSEELRNAYMGYYAYWGTYSVNETLKTISHQVESSLWPEEVGVERVRDFALVDEQLILTTPPYQRGNEQRFNRLTWKKVE